MLGQHGANNPNPITAALRLERLSQRPQATKQLNKWLPFGVPSDGFISSGGLTDLWESEGARSPCQPMDKTDHLGMERFARQRFKCCKIAAAAFEELLFQECESVCHWLLALMRSKMSPGSINGSKGLVTTPATPKACRRSNSSVIT